MVPRYELPGELFAGLFSFRRSTLLREQLFRNNGIFGLSAFRLEKSSSDTTHYDTRNFLAWYSSTCKLDVALIWKFILHHTYHVAFLTVLVKTIRSLACFESTLSPECNFLKGLDHSSKFFRRTFLDENVMIL